MNVTPLALPLEDQIEEKSRKMNPEGAKVFDATSLLFEGKEEMVERRNDTGNEEDKIEEDSDDDFSVGLDDHAVVGDVSDEVWTKMHSD